MQRPGRRRKCAAPGAEGRRQAQLLDLFDRFLGLATDATRRFGGLFPYNHLCRRMQSVLAGTPARVIVTADDGVVVATLAVTWQDGELRRTTHAGRGGFVWSVPLDRLEHAAAQPWVYLADPKRLGFAWFHEPGSHAVPSLSTRAAS